jgi:hypothetical protein
MVKSKASRTRFLDMNASYTTSKWYVFSKLLFCACFPKRENKYLFFPILHSWLWPLWQKTDYQEKTKSISLSYNKYLRLHNL